MSNPPSIRQLAESALDFAVAEFNADQFAAAEAGATIAVARALLHIGDVLREGFTRGYYDIEVD